MIPEGTPGKYTVQRYQPDGKYVSGEGVGTIAEALKLKARYERDGYRVDIIEGKPPKV